MDDKELSSKLKGKLRDWAEEVGNIQEVILKYSSQEVIVYNNTPLVSCCGSLFVSFHSRLLQPPRQMAVPRLESA